MNIFKLSECPFKSAEMMCDKHVVKMIIETAQLLSTAHRVLDGNLYLDKTANGRSIKRWRHPDERMENNLYKASHVNHPSAVWCRETSENYYWLYRHFTALCSEYTYRYDKIHKTETLLVNSLLQRPKNILDGLSTPLPQAMPDQYKREDVTEAYRAYYIGEKNGFAKWTKREVPEFWREAYPDSQAA